MEIKDIGFSLEEGYIEFNFILDGNKSTAYMQLPNTSDSQNEMPEWLTQESREELESILEEYYYDQFDSAALASASALLGYEVVKIEEIEEMRNLEYYRAYDADDYDRIIQRSNYSDYHNVLLFQAIDEDDKNILAERGIF